MSIQDIINRPRHKVFVSYHHSNDQWYRDKFESLFANYYDVMVSKSVQIGDIDSNLATETIRQKIRDEYLKDSTVTVVLIGTDTWSRKHVDWEIGSSIHDTNNNPRSGLLGIILPGHPSFGSQTSKPSIIPPRLYYNVKRKYADLYDWNTDPIIVQGWIDNAFNKKNDRNLNPDNSLLYFKNNLSGTGWSE